MIDPGTRALLAPAVAQAGLTLLVWVALYVARLREMRRRRIDPQSLATSRQAAGALDDVAAADNFRNLFEVPVLFFAALPALALLGAAGPAAVTLAWAFVALRALHSLIHLTYNRVVHRFVVYVLGTLSAFALWGLVALALVEAA